MRRLRAQLSYANVMSSIAVFMVLGGSAYAAATLPKNSVGSKQIKSNAVTSSKVKNGSLLSKDFKAGQLPAGAAGLAGPAGAKGDKGDKGDTGSVDTSNFYTKSQSDARRATQVWVVVSSTGAILRQSGGFTVTHTAGSGVYSVNNPSIDESKLGFASGVFKQPGGGSSAGFVTVYANDASGFQVLTRDGATPGTLADGGFGIVAPTVDASGAPVG